MITEDQEKDLAEYWHDFMKTNYYQILMSIVTDKQLEKAEEVFNDSSEDTHSNAWRRGVIAGMKQAMSIPEDLVEKHITNVETESTDQVN